MTPAAPGVVALVTHVRTVPTAERVAFAARLRDAGGDHVLGVETCHRVEGYVQCSPDEAGHLARRLGLPDGGRVLTDALAVRHAISVAVGRDSVVVGEDQILHQLRTAVDGARAAGDLAPTLERLFAVALRAGRRARSWRHGPPTSLADVALGTIGARAGSLVGRRVLVVGSGRMGQVAARAAVTTGAVVSVANRSAAGARSVAAQAGADIERFDPGVGIRDYAGVIVAIAGPWTLGPASVAALAGSTTVVVDLSVPGAVTAEAIEGLGDRFLSADAVADRASEAPAEDARETARIGRLIDDTTSEFLAWMDARDRRATADVLRQRADADREAELAALWRHLPDLDPEARDAIAGMTRHLADRLLREPLERLGRDRDGQDERAIRDLFAL